MSLTVKDILIIAALGMVFFPLISITFSTCTEIWFNRKEKHMSWCSKQIENARKEHFKKNEQV